MRQMLMKLKPPKNPGEEPSLARAPTMYVVRAMLTPNEYIMRFCRLTGVLKPLITCASTRQDTRRHPPPRECPRDGSTW